MRIRCQKNSMGCKGACWDNAVVDTNNLFGNLSDQGVIELMDIHKLLKQANS